MSLNSASTPFPIGAYLGNPDNSSVANEATFESGDATFSSLMGIAPQLLDVFIDQSQPVDQWVGNSQWNASSFAASADARSVTPVIALPLNSTAAGALSPDQSFKAFASGQYDGVIAGIVQVWANEGFKNLVFRPGWEMNLPGVTYAGDSAVSQSDWVAAFQHVYTALHAAAAADGVNVQVVWNPSTTNYSNAEATTNLYPGDNYVDVIGADAYANIYPYSDGGATATYHDWATGAEDTTTAQFIASPSNREHYWSNPAATKWSQDSSGGHSQSLDSLIQFAELHGKPFAIPETGAGNSADGNDVADDAAFPQWLSQQLTAAVTAGATISFVNLWDSNGGGNYEFSYAADNKPGEAAAWAAGFGARASASSPAAVSIGSGPASLVLSVAEDAWQGHAQFTVSVDGTQVGGIQTATASQSAGATQTFTVNGSFSAGSHAVSVDFLNDAYGGSATTDRNLYVDAATFNGASVLPNKLALMSSGSQAFTFAGNPVAANVTLGSGSDILALSVNEDAWNGDAQFTVSVDGAQIGGVQTAGAIRSAGQNQTFNVHGTFGTGQHTVNIDFLNDAYGGSATTDRNLYVNGATIDGTAVGSSSLNLLAGGAQGFSFAGASTGAPDTLDLHVSEDAWQGDAQFTININGQTIGGTHSATASHAGGATQDVLVSGNWGANPTIGITFTNDAYGGSTSTDRNLYVTGATYDGQAVQGAPATLDSNGTATLAVPAGSTALTLNLAEDAWNGDAQYAVAIDGRTLVAGSPVTALHSQGQSQAIDLAALLAPGTHDLAVSFLNDAYGGSSSADRNLYVTGVGVNGSQVTNGAAALYSNGTQHFQIVVPTPA